MTNEQPILRFSNAIYIKIGLWLLLTTSVFVMRGTRNGTSIKLGEAKSS